MKSAACFLQTKTVIHSKIGMFWWRITGTVYKVNTGAEYSAYCNDLVCLLIFVRIFRFCLSRPIPGSIPMSQMSGGHPTAIPQNAPRFYSSSAYQPYIGSTTGSIPATGQTNPTQESNPSAIKRIDNVLEDFAVNYSTAHGLPNIYKSDSVLGRIFWTFLFLGAAAVCGWQFEQLITKYIAFDTATEVRNTLI